jgi:hypothetical protein
MSLWQEWKAKNLAQQEQGNVSPLDFLNPETEYVDTETADNRLSICESCPELMVTKQCSLCHCFMPAKVKLLHSACPKELW